MQVLLIWSNVVKYIGSVKQGMPVVFLQPGRALCPVFSQLEAVKLLFAQSWGGGEGWAQAPCHGDMATWFPFCWVLSATILCTQSQCVCIFHTCVQREAWDIEELPRAAAVAVTASKCCMRNLGHVLVCSLKLAFMKCKWQGLTTGSQHLTELEYLAAAEYKSFQGQLPWCLLPTVLVPALQYDVESSHAEVHK